MSTFADRIREAAQKKSTKAFKDTGSSITAQIQSQQTGKEVAPQATGQSNIAAQMAAAPDTSVQQQTQAAAEGMAVQEQQADIKQKGIEADREMKQKALDSQNLQATQDILANAQRSEKTLDQREDSQQLEQAAASLRMQDKEYTAKLNNIAQENDMTDRLSYNEAMTRYITGEETKSFMDDVDYDEKMNTIRNAQSLKDLSAGLETARQAEEARIKDERKGMIISGAAQAGKATLEYGAGKGWFDSKEKGASDLGETIGEGTSRDPGSLGYSSTGGVGS